MLSLLLAAAAGSLASLWLERLAKPGAGALARPVAALAIHCGLFAVAGLLLAALVQRPFLGASLALALQVLIIVVSNAKHRALREPLVHADFGLYLQALRFPRLYLPYLQIVPLLAALAAFAAALAAGLALEPPNLYWDGWAILLVGAIALIAFGSRAAPQPSLDPIRDTSALGLIVACWLYWLAEMKSAPDLPAATPFPARTPPARLPHIVVVECESFFDPRPLNQDIARDVLRCFDALRAEGEGGRLAVPAWGAYTMRTEFAFLSAIPAQRLGVHRFNPYRRLGRRGVPTIASRLKSLGYRTLCVHPFAASFFAREQVFPGLGFDEFLDERSFDEPRHEGPYVADAEVARRAIELLRGARQPTFVFAITMENHGPHQLEAGPGGDELAVYLRHLRNSDAMIGALADALRGEGGVLCVFGDHVPSLPRIYAAAGFDDPRTEYLIWRQGLHSGRRSDISVDRLAERLLQIAGLAEGEREEIA